MSTGRQMRGLFPKTVVMLMALALSACVTLAPAKGKPGADNPVTGGEIEVTSLDPPNAKDGKAPKKVAPEAPVKVEDDKPGETPAPPVADAAPKADAPKVKPKPRPDEDAQAPDEAAADTPPAPEEADPQPQATKSPSQIACEKKGNIWAKIGDSGANYCAKRTRDNGKQCNKASDCESVCLARSGTCAPFDPLLGCNEILQQDGSRVTLCIN